jgi:hypothetical protein
MTFFKCFADGFNTRNVETWNEHKATHIKLLEKQRKKENKRKQLQSYKLIYGSRPYGKRLRIPAKERMEIRVLLQRAREKETS